MEDLLIPYEDKFMWLHNLYNIFVAAGGGFLAPYEVKLMLFLIQRSCQKGWRMLISYEDKLMWLYTPFNIFARGGGGCLIPYEYKTYTLLVLPHSTWLDTGDDDGDDDDDDDDDDEEDDDDDDDDCKCGATSRLDGRNIL